MIQIDCLIEFWLKLYRQLKSYTYIYINALVDIANSNLSFSLSELVISVVEFADTANSIKLSLIRLKDIFYSNYMNL